MSITPTPNRSAHLLETRITSLEAQYAEILKQNRVAPPRRSWFAATCDAIAPPTPKSSAHPLETWSINLEAQRKKQLQITHLETQVLEAKTRLLEHQASLCENIQKQSRVAEEAPPRRSWFKEEDSGCTHWSPPMPECAAQLKHQLLEAKITTLETQYAEILKQSRVAE